MATSTMLAILLALLVLLPASSAQIRCNMNWYGMMACMPAIKNGTDPAKPAPPACCAALAGADIPCLCSYKDDPRLASFGIDPALAIKLPTKCNPGSKGDPCK